jgi:hypothetical protein
LPFACLKTLESAPSALWSAVTRHRFFRLADLSAKQRRAERRAQSDKTTAGSRIIRLTTFDGDKSPAESGDESPHSKGVAVKPSTQLFKHALMKSEMEIPIQFRHQLTENWLSILGWVITVVDHIGKHCDKIYSDAERFSLSPAEGAEGRGERESPCCQRLDRRSATPPNPSP